MKNKPYFPMFIDLSDKNIVVTVTGVHDAPSVAAVKWLQRLAALPQTGEIDQTTWAYLSGLYTLASGDGDGADLHSGS